MPIDLILVRHGESEGNVANDLEREGRINEIPEKFRGKHSSQFRLTELGKVQAIAAGIWLKSNIAEKFGRYYVSEYLRALETAALLELQDANWMLEFYLRERDWGELDMIPEHEKIERYGDNYLKRREHGMLWTPFGGESVARACERIDRVIHTLHRECSEMKVIIVCHGEIMWAFRCRLERMSIWQYLELENNRHPHNKINNGQILHYSRRNPKTGKIEPYLNYMRSVCPWDTSLSSNEWQRIERQKYSNQDLFELIKQFPPDIV